MKNPVKRIKLLIVDDHAIVREGLRAIFSFQKDFETVGEAEDGLTAARMTDALRPDVIIMDLMMQNVDGADATAMIKGKHPDVAILILTSFGDSANLRRALANGANGAIAKTQPKDELFAAIRAVADGGRVISEEISHMLNENETMPDLTPRQLDILQSLTRGLTNKDIAKQFGLSTAGVKFHLLTIFRKLEVSNRSEAVALALRRHLVNVQPS